IAGTLSVVLLTFLAPFLARVTLSFGPPEYFALMVLGLTLLTYFARESMVKALMMAAVGLLCGVVGQDTISGRLRFSFGIRTLEGVLGPESANNAAAGGAFIPLLTLGIPANAVMAILLGALMIHGLQPGPLLVTQAPDVFWGIITSMYIGNAMLLVLNLPLIPMW